MKKVKPRGPTPSLIGGSNGRPKRVTVGKKSKCSRCHSPFEKEQTCIAIPQVGGAHTSHRRVCDECFAQILEKTTHDLEALHLI